MIAGVVLHVNVLNDSTQIEFSSLSASTLVGQGVPEEPT